MTARTSWCSLWKPSLQKGTELLKYQTQRWIPLQTCSLFFTVGLRLCVSVERLHTADEKQDRLFFLRCMFTPSCLEPCFKYFLESVIVFLSHTTF